MIKELKDNEESCIPEEPPMSIIISDEEGSAEEEGSDEDEGTQYTEPAQEVCRRVEKLTTSRKRSSTADDGPPRKKHKPNSSIDTPLVIAQPSPRAKTKRRSEPALSQTQVRSRERSRSTVPSYTGISSSQPVRGTKWYFKQEIWCFE